jgi:hypothetical protein
LVKTIWRYEEAVSLNSFYYPTQIEINQKRKNISTIDEFPRDKKAVIQGTVGQGKSIYLRYLCVQELFRVEYIPIFIQLRHIDKETKLEDLIFSTLSSMGLQYTASPFFYPLCIEPE